MEDYLKEVKINIRSLLAVNVCKGALLLSDFLNDYKEFNGEQLPYSTFGYHNPKDFLASLKDTVILDSNFGRTTISCLSDNRNNHIAALVSKQNPPKQKPSHTNRRSGGRPMKSSASDWRTSLASSSSTKRRYVPSAVKNTSVRQFSSNSVVMPLMGLSNFRPSNLPSELGKSTSQVEKSTTSTDLVASKQLDDDKKDCQSMQQTVSNPGSLFLPTHWQNAPKKDQPSKSSVSFNDFCSNIKADDTAASRSGSGSPQLNMPGCNNLEKKQQADLPDLHLSDASSTTTALPSIPSAAIQFPVANMNEQTSVNPLLNIGLHNQWGIPLELSPANRLCVDIVNLLLLHRNGIIFTEFNAVFYQTFHYWILPQIYGSTNLWEMLAKMPFVTIRNTGNALLVLRNPLLKPTHFHPQTGMPLCGYGPLPFPERRQGLSYQEVPGAVVLEQATVNPTQGQLFCSPMPPTPPIKPLRPLMETLHIGENLIRPEPLNPPPGFDKKILQDVVSPFVGAPVHRFCAPPGFTQAQPVSDAVFDTETQRPHVHGFRPVIAAAAESSTSEVIHDDARSAESPFPSVSDNEDSTDAKLTPHRAYVSAKDKINSVVKSVFRKILAKKPSGFFLNDLPAEYKKITNHSLPVTEYGCHSVLELVGLIPDVFKIRRTLDSSDWILSSPENTSHQAGLEGNCGAEYIQEITEVSQLPLSPSKIKISDELQHRIVKVVCMFPNGLVESDFPFNYKIVYDEEFKLDGSIGYDLKEIFKSMSHLLSINYTDDNSMIIQALQERESILNVRRADPLPEVRDYSLLSHKPPNATCLIPSDAAGKKAVFLKETNYESKKEGDYIEVTVSHVFHPGKFFVQLQGKKTSFALENLMEALRVLYTGPDAKEYAMPLSHINVGQICVAIYSKDANWYRGIIVNELGGSCVRVLFVDFGNSAEVDVNCVFLIKNEFLALPCQAVRSKLQNCFPISGPLYTNLAIKRFRELTEDRHLIAQLCHWENCPTNPEENFLLLNLCDTSGSDDLYINEDLVKNGHATITSNEIEPLRLPKPRDSVVEQPQDITQGKNVNLSSGLQQDGDGFGVFSHTMGDKLTRHFLLGHNVYIAHITRDYYIPTFEVSKYIWGYDILRKKLQIEKCKVDFLVFDEKADSVLYENLQRLQKNVEKHLKMGTNKIELLLLSRVPEVVAIFSSDTQKCQRIALAFQELHQSLINKN